eukprot:TRINITY_DN26518_c0_g1_i1.p1 TRINITY_DN26518_c0_g1~~TRINITY_DN26518_c0_g1_i1.p1  ORF type:complete len:586 (-),score=124.15 TRINITY_DN26518_c0_g1_i1:9-1649(-)
MAVVPKVVMPRMGKAFSSASAKSGPYTKATTVEPPPHLASIAVPEMPFGMTAPSNLVSSWTGAVSSKASSPSVVLGAMPAFGAACADAGVTSRGLSSLGSGAMGGAESVLLAKQVQASMGDGASSLPQFAPLGDHSWSQPSFPSLPGLADLGAPIAAPVALAPPAADSAFAGLKTSGATPELTGEDAVWRDRWAEVFSSLHEYGIESRASEYAEAISALWRQGDSLRQQLAVAQDAADQLLLTATREAVQARVADMLETATSLASDDVRRAAIREVELASASADAAVAAAAVASQGAQAPAMTFATPLSRLLAAPGSSTLEDLVEKELPSLPPPMAKAANSAFSMPPAAQASHVTPALPAASLPPSGSLLPPVPPALPPPPVLPAPPPLPVPPAPSSVVGLSSVHPKVLGPKAGSQAPSSARSVAKAQPPSVAEVHNNVYVSGLPVGIDETMFRQLFLSYGHVLSTKLVPGKHIGFVRFGTAKDAQAAIDALNNFEFKGTRLTLRPAARESGGAAAAAMISSPAAAVVMGAAGRSTLSQVETGTIL